MSTSSLIFAIVAGVLIISVLVWVIVRQLKQDGNRKKDMKDAEATLLEGRKKRIESIHVLLKVVGSEDLGWMEASIRVKTLLDQLSLDLSEHETIGVFYKVYAQTEHIPTHEGWNNLPKDARRKFRIEMMKCEAQYQDELEQARVALLEYPLK
ncbi:hypothetical protein MED121_07951 [Marinomonas sp. MED121]|uniref:DUF2489 domain-containing protein n=1 Tax=Marinomonas sp. MED121 TaxID=314277 RepID=UPI00006909D1|nr:DUF2489 domain-containing protein [Marinomonas sp. MED121]EAQ63183.1 hypothetical protein MED121_07951 [Marinomonas sp. MED121]